MKEKLNKVAISFSIKDLEELTGVKAHTIRIWENRYNLIEPNRTSTNIRRYNMEQLHMLLNVSLLNRNGEKISKIAKCSSEEISIKVLTLANTKSSIEKHINDLKIAAINFDIIQFNHVINSLLKDHSFHDVFLDILIPFLDYVGLLWQSKVLNPSHEHFVSNLIKQKLHYQTELISNDFAQSKVLFIPFLPLNEIHELGLLFLHYKILNMGYESIYLGQSVPMEDLVQFASRKKKVVYVSAFTVAPSDESALEYIQKMHELIPLKQADEMWFSGNKTRNITNGELPRSCSVFDSFKEVFERMEDLESSTTLINKS